MLLLLSSFAFAGDHYVGGQVFRLPVAPDSGGSAAGMYGGQAMGGVEVAWPLVRHLQFIGSLGSSSAGTTVYGDEDSTFDGLEVAWWGTDLGLGLQGDLAFGQVFGIYAKAEGVGLLNYVRMDDDPDVDDNATQVSGAGVTGGAELAAGVQFHIPLGHTGTALTLRTDAGYLWTAPGQVGEFGQLQFAGFTIGGGAGVSF